MYQLARKPFGPFEEIEISREQSGQRLSLIPAYGAAIRQLSFGQQGRSYPLLDGYASPEEILVQGKRFKATALLPFPNRLRGGAYRWAGQDYAFPITEPSRGNNLHGFPQNLAFEVGDIRLGSDSASIGLQASYRSQYACYPFDFDIHVELSIHDSGRFVYALRLVNCGDSAMPWGFGWHPYFATPGGIAGWQLQMPASTQILVDAEMIPDGRVLAFDRFREPRPIGEYTFDTCFLLRDRGEAAAFHLQGSDYSIRMHCEGDGAGFPFMQLYTPAHGQSIAIEPMTCGVNAFAEGAYLITPGPGEAWSGRILLDFSATGHNPSQG